ncbi:hypothetical protein AAG570_010378 [Ranatra chinensis]|uniref:RNA methyltransferase n=1 Tax=Ranatra chinensis TaxID=642074 RepID=A0ABD0YMC7_9HEMI
MKTISLVVPGSILDCAQSPQLQAYVAGQIARAACIYNVDEVIVFNDMGDTPSDGIVIDSDKSTWRSCVLLGRILQFLECPQYLRKCIFPIHKDLHYAGLLNPLDAPHHLRADDESLFREGIVTDKRGKHGKGCYANVGLMKPVYLEKTLKPGVRVTVKLLPKEEGSKKLKGIVVPPSFPRFECGTYWGYNVRLAKSLSEAIDGCPYKEGYDLLIGTSDKGTPVSEITLGNDYHHCLIVFGGVRGLEIVLETDDKLKVEDVSMLFHHYVNTCPRQGTRTIRTEEAILISLAQLSNKLLN